MQSIDTSGLSELRRTFQQARQSIPQLQREAHERLGQVVQRTVRGNISTSLNDSHGKIASWQDVFVGSRGGYVAVRATDSPAGRNGAGAVTNYLENGHVKRKRRTYIKNQARYIKIIRARAGNNWVEGRHFYQKSKSSLQREVQREAENILNQLVSSLGG